MDNRYYYEKNCDWLDEDRERREILGERIHSACIVTILLSVLWIIGTIGSADIGNMSIIGFVANVTIAVCVLLASIWVNASV